MVDPIYGPRRGLLAALEPVVTFAEARANRIGPMAYLVSKPRLCCLAGRKSPPANEPCRLFGASHLRSQEPSDVLFSFSGSLAGGAPHGADPAESEKSCHAPAQGQKSLAKHKLKCRYASISY